MRLSFISTNWLAISAKLILSRILIWIYANIRAFSRLFPHVISQSWPKECFYALESRKDAVTFRIWWLVKIKKSLTIFPTSLITKFLFRHVSGNFLIMLLITIVSWSLSSNKLGNNFNCDTNLLMTKSCNWLATHNNFWCCNELKMWLSGALFEKKRDFLLTIWHMSFFEQKVNSFIKIR